MLLRQLQKQDVKKIITVTVPGAVEIPFAIKSFWENAGKKEKTGCIYCIGLCDTGDTPHFDYVCKAVTDGVLQLNLSLPVPTIFGVLTVDNEATGQRKDWW